MNFFNFTNMSKLIMGLSWLSMFVWVWLFIFDLLPHSPVTYAGFLFFLIIAFCSGAYEESKNKR